MFCVKQHKIKYIIILFFMFLMVFIFSIDILTKMLETSILKGDWWTPCLTGVNPCINYSN